MKKSMFASVKPLAMATAVAAGTSVSMIAMALPGGDTLGAAGVVNESVCHNAVDMTIASGTRSVTTGTGDCQLRTLAPTKGFVLVDSAPAGATVTDSSALLNAGGELYETFVGGNRQGTVLLTPNRSLAVTRSSSFVSGTDGALSFDVGAAVQPSTGLQDSWLTGTYNIITRNHSIGKVASDLENSIYAAPNHALGERNFTVSMDVTFNGDGTCDIAAMDNRQSFQLTKDPMMNSFGEMDNGCTTGGGMCGQNDGNNYVARGVVNAGSTGSQVDYFDWNDQSGDGKGGRPTPGNDCTYTTSAGVVSVTYNTQNTSSYLNEFDEPVTDVVGQATWTVNYNVSADLRYLVSSAPGTQSSIGGSGNIDGEGAGVGVADKGDIAIGVRVNAGDVTGKTFLFNKTAATYAASTPNTASYENPSSPTNQEEECITRGSIEFTNTDVGGGFNECNVQSVSTCTGRSISGYEESTAGGADGTVTDSFSATDGVDPAVTCRWSNTGGLVVQMDTTDPEANPITLAYTGDVSDNGEALVLHGGYNTTGLAPDVENPPLLPQQKYNMVDFIVAQEYQGSLTADADADTATNYDEFVWAADVTPAGGSTRSDFDKDADSDVYFRNASGLSHIWVMQAGNQQSVSNLGYTNSGFSFGGIGDFDADGDKDVMLRNNSTGELRVLIIENGAQASTASLGFNSTAFTMKGVADVDADGDGDVVLRNDTSGQVVVVLIQGGAKVGQSDFGYNNAAFTFAGIGDTNGDLDDDIVLRNNTSGQMIVLNAQAGAKASQSDLGYNSAAMTFKSVVDADADGDADMLLRNDSTGQMLVVLMQAGAKSGQSDLGYNTTAMTFKAVGDTNGDGDSDIILRDTAGKTMIVTLQGGVKDTQSDLGYNNSAWVIVGTGDFDADGDDDIFFRQDANGSNLLFTLQNSAKASQTTLPFNSNAFVASLEK